MKVLMIGPARSVNGGISAVVNNYYKAGLDKELELEYIGTMEDGSKWHKLKIAVGALIKFIVKVSKYELVHVHMASDFSLYRKLPFIWLTKVLGKKLVIQQHGGNIKQFYYSECSEKRQNFIKRMLRKADVFIVVAPYLQDIFKDIVEEEKIVVLPNAVEIPPKISHNYREQNLLFLGRLCKEKGIYELLDATKELKPEFPDLHLYLGGIWADGVLEKKAEEYKEFVHYLGWIDAEKKDEYLQKCNIFVLPTYFEGMPMSLLEGMAYGRACVATEVGGIPQVMMNRKEGIMIQPKDVQALKNAIKELLQNPPLQEEVGSNGRRKIEDKFELNKSVYKLIQIYQKIS
mgnify:CR=1 FL=1